MPDSHPLAEALKGVAGEGSTLSWISGCLVTGVSTATTPYTLTVRLPDGSSVPDVPFLGATPAVNARVEVLRRGPQLLALGSPAGPAVTPPAPPPAPAAPPSLVNRTVQPVDRQTWTPGGAYWKGEVIQGGELGKRAFFLYGTGIADAKGSGTITGGTIWVQRADTSHGTSGGANVRVGTHPNTTRPATGNTGHGDVAALGTLLRGKGQAFPLTAVQVAALNAGSQGLGLEPGAASYSSPDYLVAVLAESGALALTIST